ncbi:uncharacterized protein LOC132903547 [Amyelois transitella]|uniref:uncharacterized protein LOC132903547 n=1 Tax=Amyelois transitella TaxID=680683 RepID=UPI00298F93F2|nr:uncharacterized protein LOC132903547 [Amyelois transitella]
MRDHMFVCAMDLFSMDDKLPFELRALPYDLNSVMHFGEREFSKNGHRTIIILDHKVQQKREGLSDLDLRKIDIVYGPECRKRDRLEKIDLCQGFPGVARRKREVGDFVREKRNVDEPVTQKEEVKPTEVKSLRVNPDITAPPELADNSTNDAEEEFMRLLEDLGIKDGVDEVTSFVYKLGAQALNKTRIKYCNVTNVTKDEIKLVRRSAERRPDIFGVVETIAEYVKDMVDHALSNITAFCEAVDDFKSYQRQRCSYYSGGANRCPVFYRSTKTGPLFHSTKHRPIIPQSTKHAGSYHRPILYHQGRRTDDTPENPDDGERKKRDVGNKEELGGESERKKREAQEFIGRRYNVRKETEMKWDESVITMEKTERPKKKVLEGHRNKRKDNRKRYDLFYIYTCINDLTDLRRRLDAVNGILKARTCVTLEEITEQDAERFEDYLVLDGSADYITGRVGGRQVGLD